jgi:ABC-2 type transport system ATP-binding protein
LEAYFLNVVKRARENDAQTSGATSGNRVAAYLRGDADQSAASPDRVLERLTASAVVPAFEPKASVAPAVSAVNQAKLESLATVETTVATPAPVPTPEAAQASLSQANEKLSNLLGGSKK